VTAILMDDFDHEGIEPRETCRRLFKREAGPTNSQIYRAGGKELGFETGPVKDFSAGN
jgi:hypothetical protein